MKVNSLNNRDITFNGFWNSKGVKKTLKFADKNGAMFVSATSFAFSLGVRPLVIMSTPNTEKDNRKVATAKALSSALTEVALTYAISAPLAKSMSAINKSPEKYLKPETIKNLKESTKNLEDSKAYILASQMFKLGIGVAIAVPKSILTVLGMPYVLKGFSDENTANNNTKQDNSVKFKGKSESNFLAKIVGKVIDNPKIQEFSKKNKDSNFPMHILALRDTVATTTFVHQASKSKNIEEKRKRPVIYNALISTALSIASTYLIDGLTEKQSRQIVQKIKDANKNDANVSKYVNGFKIAKPALIAAVIYYILIPVISTYTAERVDERQVSKLNIQENNKRTFDK